MVSILVCSPTTIIPAVESEVRWCSICSTQIWVALESLTYLIAHPETQPVCQACAIGIADSEGGTDTVQAVPGARIPPIQKARGLRIAKAVYGKRRKHR